jgi:hypothetical protein
MGKERIFGILRLRRRLRFGFAQNDKFKAVSPKTSVIVLLQM